MRSPTLIVHGGAWAIPPEMAEDHKRGVAHALSSGYAILEKCELLGIDVPGRLSVVGYDGLHWPARTSHLLCTVNVDLDLLGDTAVSMLRLLIQKEADAPVVHILPVTLTSGTTLSAIQEVDGSALY